MKNLNQIVQGIKDWTSKMSSKAWDAPFANRIQFAITNPSALPLANSSDFINVYLVWMDNSLNALLIQSTYDTDDAYETSASRAIVRSKMLIVPVSSWSGVPTASTNMDPNHLYAITDAKAKERTDAFMVGASRTAAKSYNGTGPIMFQIPGDDWSTQGTIGLYFGLKILTEAGVVKTTYDMIVSNEVTAPTASKFYYNASRPMPPMMPSTFSAGLEKYAKL